jgi:cell shape-determining protein MreC
MKPDSQADRAGNFAAALSPSRRRAWLALPPGIASATTLLLLALAASLALGLAPRRFTQRLSDAWREAVSPGLRIVDLTADLIDRSSKSLRPENDRRLADAQRQIAELNDQLRKSETQLLLARSGSLTSAPQSFAKTNDTGDSGQLPPLLVTHCIPARVLGAQAQSFLRSREILDVGRAQGVAQRALVIDEPPDRLTRPLLDQGGDANISADHLVLAGNRVLGKVAEVGPHTCTVTQVTDPGYRDLVQVATRRDGRLRVTARGVLSGRGEPLCKIESVEASEPITLGDLVFTVDDGVLDGPLLYGRVARVARNAAAAKWEIWMEPSFCADAPPAKVSVLAIDLNPSRLASASK